VGVGAVDDVRRPEGSRVATVLLVVLPLLCVSPLLAWVAGLGAFSTWAVLLGIPAVLVTAGLGWRECRRRPVGRLGVAVTAGFFGGLLGTVGYDLFRVPFLAFGLRLLAPIDSYGVLMLDARASNGLTGLAGWSFHFANGICFGIAFAVVALGRRWWWALVWAMVLETATVVTPFAETYGLRGREDLILIAYLAHVPYGVVLGLLVEHGEATYRRVHEVTKWPIAATLGVLAGVLLLWLRPLPPYGTDASTEIVDGRLSPAWLRVAPGGCASIRNTDEKPYVLRGADGQPLVRAGQVRIVCFSDEGVHRVRTSERAFSGGFVIVDPEPSP